MIWIVYPSTLATDIVRVIATIRMRSHAGAWEGYQLKAGQVTSWQITRTLRQAQGASPSVDSGHRFLSLSKGAGE